jgi:flagellar basal-body rod protein FlgF
MDSTLYTSMAGLQAVQVRMAAVAANLANLQTNGYAAVQAATVAAPYTGPDAPAGADAVALTPGPNPTQGALIHTGDPLNVGLGGDAWLTVQTSAGTALTRDGSLSISAAGILTDSDGNPVLSAGGAPISVPRLAKLEIGADGTVSGIPASSPGSNPQNFGQIGMVKTPTGTMTPLGGSRYAAPAGAGLVPATDGSVNQGYLNGSNVDPTQAMVEMIDDSRSYQLQAELMKGQGGGGASADLNALLTGG